jgi:multidrug efflux pump subunit AcrA (membrane-fusion protein)
MKEKINSLKRRLSDLWSTSSLRTRIIGGVVLIGLIGSISLVFADAGHESAPVATEVKTEKIVVRTVGDIDPDGISEEGLNSFYGEITSKDIGAVYSPREGVISSWNVSVGDTVNTGSILGYVTVTSLSVEQQQNLAQQQAAALKAQLDFETSKQISEKTKGVFGEIGDRIRGLADKQKSLFSGSNSVGSTTFVTELTALEANKALLESKIQDFARTSLIEVYQIVGQNIFSELQNCHYNL